MQRAKEDMQDKKNGHNHCYDLLQRMIQSNIAKRKGAWCEVQRTRGTNFQASTVATQDALNSPSNEL